jgi:hypothetical protein
VLRDPDLRALILNPEVQSVLQACRDLQGGESDDEPAAAREREALARRLRAPEMADKMRRLAAVGLVRFD